MVLIVFLVFQLKGNKANCEIEDFNLVCHGVQLLIVNLCCEETVGPSKVPALMNLKAERIGHYLRRFVSPLSI